MIRILIVFIVLLLAPVAALHAATYHVDSIVGSDIHDGGSPAQAWRSLEKVNAATFQPGDMLLLKAGSSWTGCLHPKGSGSATQPIMLGRYGDGPPPVIHGGGIAGGAMVLQDQQYWSLRGDGGRFRGGLPRVAAAARRRVHRPSQRPGDSRL